ncbi:MAG: YoaK family protein [Gammaproteobacteria bacterium]
MSKLQALTTASPMRPELHHKVVLLVLLTFVAGFTDTAGFVLLFDLFTAHITGNTVIAAADIVHRGGIGARTAVLTLPIFIIAVIICTLIIEFAKGRWRKWIFPLMITAETLLLAAFLVTALLLDPSKSTPDGLPVLIVGGTGVIAMAVQNTIAGQLPKPSTVMTGNLTTLIINAVRWVLARRARNDGLRARMNAQIRILWPTFLAFSVGAVLAAVGVVTLNYWSLLVPVPFSAIAAIYAFKMREKLIYGRTPE